MPNIPKITRYQPTVMSSRQMWAKILRSIRQSVRNGQLFRMRRTCWGFARLKDYVSSRRLQTFRRKCLGPGSAHLRTGATGDREAPEPWHPQDQRRFFPDWSEDASESRNGKALKPTDIFG